jgi:protease I
MAARKTLEGRRIAVLAADGFEKVELTIPMKALRGEGADLDIISLRPGHIRGLNLHEPASRVAVQKTVREADPDAYDALFVPGGFINPDLLRQSAEAREFVGAFDRKGKPIATLCHGPWVFASAGLVRGRTMTSWPGIRDDLVNAGATWLDQEVVYDRNWLTSRGPQDMAPFVEAITRHFAGDAPLVVNGASRGSDPQRESPPQLVLDAMKWVPRPSVRMLVGLAAAVAAGAWYTRRRALA